MRHADATSMWRRWGWAMVAIFSLAGGCATVRAYQGAQAASLAGCHAVCAQQLQENGSHDCTCWVPREDAVYHLQPRLAEAGATH